MKAALRSFSGGGLTLWSAGYGWRAIFSSIGVERYTPVAVRKDLPNRKQGAIELPVPPQVRCPRDDDRFAICGL